MFMYLNLAIWHSSSTLNEVFPCFFLSCKANARVKPAKTQHGPHSSKIFVFFCVLFVLCRSVYCVCVCVCVCVCKCVLYYCHRVATRLQLTNISYPISPRPVFLLSSHLRGVDTSAFPHQEPYIHFRFSPMRSTWSPQLLRYRMTRKIFLRNTKILSYDAQTYWPHRIKSCCDFLYGCKYLPFKSLLLSCCLAVVPLVRTGQQIVQFFD